MQIQKWALKTELLVNETMTFVLNNFQTIYSHNFIVVTEYRYKTVMKKNVSFLTHLVSFILISSPQKGLAPPAPRSSAHAIHNHSFCEVL